MISDDDASDLILLKDLNSIVSSNSENRQKKSAEEQSKLNNLNQTGNA